jgi:hypothetical protein
LRFCAQFCQICITHRRDRGRATKATREQLCSFAEDSRGRGLNAA